MYAVYASLSTDEPIMLLNQPIGVDRDNPQNPYIDGALFQQELFELHNGSYKCIKIHINSPGGNVVEGYNICNAILKSKIPVDTYCTGIAASMAATVFMMGRKRIMSDYSAMMIHNPFGGDDKKMLGAMRQSLVTMVSAKCNLPVDEVAKMMDKETWLTAPQALEKGFATSIEVTSESNQHRMPRASVYAMWTEANKINNTSKTSFMSENTIPAAKIDLSLVAAYLELSPEASGPAVLTALKTRVNSEILAKEGALDELATMKAALAKKDKEFGEMKDALDTANATIKSMKDAAASAQAKADKEVADAKLASDKIVARTEIEVYATAGRIKKEQVDGYVEIAITSGIDKVKALLGDAPINKDTPAAAKIATDGAGAIDPAKTPMSSMSLMAKVQANVNAKHK